MTWSVLRYGLVGLVLIVSAAAVGQSQPASQPAASQPTPTTVPADEHAVTVNGHMILERDVMDLARRSTPAEVWDDREGRYKAVFSMYRGRIVSRLIYARLLDEQIEQAGIRLDDTEMQRRIEEELRAYLSLNGLTREQFDQQLQTERGQTLEEFAARRLNNPRQRRNALERKLFETLNPAIREVSEPEIEKYYADKREERFQRPGRVRASHILLSTEGKSDEEKAALRKRAEELLADARKPGADFAALAQQHSDCPSKTRGGDLDYFERKGTQPEPLAELAFRLSIGEVGGPVETWSGYHIVKVTERREEKNITLEQAREGIRYALIDRQYQEARRQYLRGLKEKAQITYPPGKEPPELHDRGAPGAPDPEAEEQDDDDQPVGT